jgi:hypothetical protein
VQEAAKQNVILHAPEDDAKATSGKPSRKVVMGIGLVTLLFAGMMFSRLSGSRSVAMIDSTPTETLTPTPAISPTPTPLALESQDDVIQGSDGSREVTYPVSLQVILPEGSAPRLWVVQRRRVQASEWRYDLNPDTASFVSGMSVLPVIGIPWTEENATYFDEIDEGTSFQLTMNTGAILTYTFEDKRDVRRSETGIFRQVSPGLALLLIGETDEEGFPTATRTLITANYPPEQELERIGEVIGMIAQPNAVFTPIALPNLIPTLDPIYGLNVQIISVTTQAGQITTRFRLYNGGSSPIPIATDDLWIALGYMESPIGPRILAEGVETFVLLPEQAADLRLMWYWTGEPYANLGIGEHRFAIQFSR